MTDAVAALRAEWDTPLTAQELAQKAKLAHAWPTLTSAINAVIAEPTAIDMPEIGTYHPITAAHLLVTQFAAHAAMVNTMDPTEPAVPAVQLQVSGITVMDPASKPAKVTLLLEAKGAHDIVHGISNALQLLKNLATNQEGL